MKKIISVLLMCALVLGLCPMTAAAQYQVLGSSGETKTFYEYFPDVEFAKAVAEEVGKQPEQKTTAMELAGIRQLTIISDAMSTG